MKVDHVTHEGHSTDDELKAFDEKAQEYEDTVGMDAKKVELPSEEERKGANWFV
jgi:hypothetical protein